MTHTSAARSTSSCVNAARPGADAIHRPSAGLDPDEVVAEVIELLLDPRLTSSPDGHNADDRGDSDGDPEHREQAAHLVSQKCPNGAAQQGQVVHVGGD